MFLSLPSRAICSSSRAVSRLGYEAAFPFSNLAMPQPQPQLRHESLAVAIAIDPASILALQEQISIIKPMENIQEVGHLQMKTEPHGGSNSEIQRYWDFSGLSWQNVHFEIQALPGRCQCRCSQVSPISCHCCQNIWRQLEIHLLQ